MQRRLEERWGEAAREIAEFFREQLTADTSRAPGLAMPIPEAELVRLVRITTEAQWEYACRAGSEAACCFGNDEKQLRDYAWYGEDWEKGSTHPVGKKKAIPGHT